MWNRLLSGNLHVKGVDFVCGRRPGIEAAEVKYRNRIDRRDLSGLRRAFGPPPPVGDRTTSLRPMPLSGGGPRRYPFGAADSRGAA